MRTLRSSLTSVAFITTLLASAQLGGKSAFLILDIPSSARISALGGSPVAVLDNDLNLGLFNPALLNSEMAKQVALSYLPYVAGINIGYASYCHHFECPGITTSASVQYIDYGPFRRRDETGADLGTFKAGEYVVQLGGARAIDSLFRVGVNLKYITSQLEDYKANGLAADIGGVFTKKALGLTVAATLRNIGFVTRSYSDSTEKLPFQAQLAATYRFRHAPFRFGVSLDNLQKWDLTYTDPTTQNQIDPTTGKVIVTTVSTAHRVMLHVTPSVEILFGKNFMLRVAYNYKRRQELKVDDKPGLSGLSFGIGLKVSKVILSYSYTQFNPAAASNTISLSVRFADFKKAAPKS